MFRFHAAALLLMSAAGLGGCGYTQIAQQDPGLEGDEPVAEENVRPNDPWRPPLPDPSARPLRGEGAREACAMALFVTDPFDSPETIRHRIEEDLFAIRTQWGSRVPETNWIFYRPPIDLTRLVVTLDAGALERIRRGEDAEWNDLNDRWGVDASDVRRRWDGSAELNLVSDFCVDLASARRDYERLPGVSEVSVLSAFGDGTTIYFEYDLFTSSYIFREGEGDCPSGCIHNRYWYFEVSGGNPHFIGAYDPEVFPTEPDWFARAREIIERNRSRIEEPGGRWPR